MVSRETIINTQIKRHDKLRKRSELFLYVLVLLGLAFMVLSFRSMVINTTRSVEWTPTEVVLDGNKMYDRRLRDRSWVARSMEGKETIHIELPLTKQTMNTTTTTISNQTYQVSKVVPPPVAPKKPTIPPPINHVETPHFPLLAGNPAKLPPSLAAYVRWHAVARRSPRPPLLVWACRRGLAHVCNGVGDRLRGIEFGLLLAIATRRVFVVDWPADPYAFRMAVAPSLIDWRVMRNHSYQMPVIEHPRHSPLLLRWDRLTSNDSTEWDVRTDDLISRLQSTQEVMLYSTLYSVPLLQKNKAVLAALPDLVAMSTAELENSLLRALFQPARDTAAVLKRLLPSAAFTAGYSAVHVRTGRDFAEPDTSVGRFAGLRSNEALLAASVLNCTMRTFNLHRGAFIFLASDSIAFKDAFAALCRQRGVHLLYSKVPALHVGLSDRWRRGQQPAHLTLSGFLNVFVEFFGIAAADRIISNGSYFSRMAGVYGNASMHSRVRAKLGIC